MYKISDRFNNSLFHGNWKSFHVLQKKKNIHHNKLFMFSWSKMGQNNLTTLLLYLTPLLWHRTFTRFNRIDKRMAYKYTHTTRGFYFLNENQTLPVSHQVLPRGYFTFGPHGVLSTELADIFLHAQI